MDSAVEAKVYRHHVGEEHLTKANEQRFLQAIEDAENKFRDFSFTSENKKKLTPTPENNKIGSGTNTDMGSNIRLFTQGVLESLK